MTSPLAALRAVHMDDDAGLRLLAAQKSVDDAIELLAGLDDRSATIAAELLHVVGIAITMARAIPPRPSHRHNRPLRRITDLVIPVVQAIEEEIPDVETSDIRLVRLLARALLATVSVEAGRHPPLRVHDGGAA